MPAATLLIRRGLPGEAPRHEAFTLEFEPGESVLDGLRRLREASDPSLAFRYACLNANACKECMMLVDGQVAYACTARLEAREMRLDRCRTSRCCEIWPRRSPRRTSDCHRIEKNPRSGGCGIRSKALFPRSAARWP
jgi:hypothetical protein